MSVRKAVFLDRDGVINRSIVRDGKPYAPRTLEEFELFPGVTEATQHLSDAGFLLFVVTNQPDIGNGLVDAKLVDKIHQQLLQTLPIKKIYMCPHKQDEGCDCRKPKPGMLLQARNEFSIELAESYMIGDRHTDISAARSAGCVPIFVDHDYVETPDLGDTMRAKSLLQASQYILDTHS